MMRRLLCCRDGILRVVDGDGLLLPKDGVPLGGEGAQARAVFLGVLTLPVLFEAGLTVGELLANLEPWQEDVSALGQLDFSAYLAEACTAAAERMLEISHIELRYLVRLEPPSGGDELVAGEKASSITTRWDYAAVLTEDGKEKHDENTEISLSFSALSAWQHVPVRVAAYGSVVDEIGARTSLASFSGKDVGNCPVEATSDIEAPEPTLFEAVILGFLWEVGFDYSPAHRDGKYAAMLRQVSSLT